MRLRIPVLCTALFVASPWAVPAWAQPEGEEEALSPDEERAIKLYGQGLKLYDRGKYKRALRKFREVDQLMASPNARLYISRCYRKMGRLPQAFEAMSAAVDIATEKAERDPSYLKTRDAAAAEREQIAVQIGRVVVAVADPPEGLEVELNSRLLDASKFGKQLGVEPGTVIVTGTAPGHDDFGAEVRVEAGKLETIAVTLRPEGYGEAEEPSDALRIAGFVVGGVGVAGMGVFAITGLLANDNFATVEEECGQPPCTDPKYTDIIEEGRTLDLVANISLVAGLTLIVAGTTMVLFGWPYEDSAEGEEPDAAEEEEETEQAVFFDVGPGKAGVVYRLRF
jgi:tetratricopeptide (TPR) repeat protein